LKEIQLSVFYIQSSLCPLVADLKDNPIAIIVLISAASESSAI